MLPYLGALEKNDRMRQPLADYVVLRLIDPLKNKGYNITTDNFFTSTRLANALAVKKTTMVGTLRANSKGLPEITKNNTPKLFESEFWYHEKNNVLFTRYQSKKNKFVCLLSTMHCNPEVDETAKQKPLLIHYYNANKCGVDAADSMLRQYTTRCATRRWPVAVWENLLDAAVLNSRICYRYATGTNISRKKFLMNLICQLTGVDNLSAGDQDVEPILDATLDTARQKCSILMCKNKTRTVCRKCRKFLCGTHCENVEKISVTLCAKCKEL